MFASRQTPHNGRVNIASTPATPSYELATAASAASGGGRAVRHLHTIQTSTALSGAYFSEANQTILQNALRYRVWRSTKHVIGRQDTMQLQIVMRSIFLQHARHSVAVPIAQQVAALNERVLAACVPDVISNVKQYVHYKQDVSTLPTPFDHAVNMSQKGSKTLSSQPFI